MLQILSTSNETSTGPELVQNGDFSELGSELVTNGDFSAAGSNLVTNPNFTDTGSELNIADGSSPEPNHFRFVDYGTNTIAYDGSGVTTITYVDDDRGGLHYFNDGYNLSSPTLTIGKSYKIEITCKVNSGTYGIQTASTIGGYNVTGLSNTDYETHTIYAYVDSISGNWMRIDELSFGQVISINDVSIKELGEDWTAYTSGTSTVEYNSSGANLLIDSGANGGSNVGVYQENIFELGKSYKIVLSMKATASFDAEVVESNLAATENVIGTVSLTTSFQDFTFYYVGTGTFDLFIHRLYNGGGASQTISIQSVVVQELGEGWIDDGTPLKAATFDANGLTITTVNGTGNNNRVSQIDVAHDSKSYKVTYTIYSATLTDSNVLQYYNGTAYVTIPTAITGTPQTFYFTSSSSSGYWNFRIGTYNGSTTDFVTISSISVKEVGQDWTLGTGWSIGADKAISAVTGSNSDITQSILTAGKTYQTIFEVVDYTAGTVQAVVTGDVGADRTAIETYTESLTATGTDFSIRSKLGTFNGSVSSVSVKLLGTYDAQSIYVTAADVQTIPQASVYYLVELTSMASKNSIYFLPSSVVPNNGRYTKLNFTVVSKDALPTPASGIISFYDSVGGFDTYPMGFYEFRIYEQTSSTNLDPTLATGLLEKGFAFVRDFSGNMQELTDGFKEYNPTLTQYVYSK